MSSVFSDTIEDSVLGFWLAFTPALPPPTFRADEVVVKDESQTFDFTEQGVVLVDEVFPIVVVHLIPHVEREFATGIGFKPRQFLFI